MVLFHARVQHMKCVCVPEEHSKQYFERFVLEQMNWFNRKCEKLFPGILFRAAEIYDSINRGPNNGPNNIRLECGIKSFVNNVDNVESSIGIRLRGDW